MKKLIILPISAIQTKPVMWLSQKVMSQSIQKRKLMRKK